MPNNIVLDNAANGTEADAHLNSKVVCVYVRSGSAEIFHDGDSLVVLAVGDRKVIDGLPIGEPVVARALADNTTLVFTRG